MTALKKLAVLGLKLDHAPGSLISGGVFVITNSPSVKVSAGGKPVFEDKVIFSFSGGNAEGFVSGSVTCPTATINTTAVKCSPGVLEGDSVVMQGTGMVGSTATAIAGLVEIVEAGQDKASGI